MCYDEANEKNRSKFRMQMKEIVMSESAFLAGAARENLKVAVEID